MNNFWDEKYAGEDYLYGTKPNEYLKLQLAGLKPGTLLLPAEGEGRNAIYAAQLGWSVWAFDSSKKGQEKALSLAQDQHLSIQYDVTSVESFHPGETGFDAIGLIYTHFPEIIRKSFFGKLQKWLNPGGIIILEAFRKDQIHRSSGGPKDLSLLYSLEDIRTSFSQLDLVQLQAETVLLDEGPGHQGTAEVVRFVGRKSRAKL